MMLKTGADGIENCKIGIDVWLGGSDFVMFPSCALCRNPLVFLLQIFNVILGVYFPLETEFLRIFAKILKNTVAMEAVERRYGVGETFKLLLLELICVPDPFTSHNIWLDHWCPYDEPARKGLNHHIIKNNF